MTQVKRSFGDSAKGLSAIESNGVIYVCMPTAYCKTAGISKGTIMDFQYDGSIICYKPMRAPIADTTTTSASTANLTDDEKKWSQISALSPNMVRALLKRIDELTDNISELSDRLSVLEKPLKARQKD